MRLRALTGPAGLLLTVVLASASLAQTTPTRLVHRDSTVVDEYLSAPKIEDMGAFVNWTEERSPKPIQIGAFTNPVLDPDGEYVYYQTIERDSSVWVQAPDGTRMRFDPYVLWTMGDQAAQRVGYDSLLVEDIGYGWEDGRFYLYLTKSAPIVWLLLGGVLTFIGAAVGLWVLQGKLREAQARGEQLAESRRRLADSREAERMRLARELHDGPLQDLQAVRMQLGVARRDQGRPGRGEASTDTVQDDVLRVISELREISEGLRPPVLASFGLAAALRALADRLRGAYPGVVLALDLRDPGKDLGDAAQLTLYRIAQESLNNALAHGRPTAVTVRLSRAADRSVHLSVTDDGVGFDLPDSLHAFEKNGSLGLAGMSERAEALGGELRVRSGPEGTDVSIQVPDTALTSAAPLL